MEPNFVQFTKNSRVKNSRVLFKGRDVVVFSCSQSFNQSTKNQFINSGRSQKTPQSPPNKWNRRLKSAQLNALIYWHSVGKEWKDSRVNSCWRVTWWCLYVFRCQFQCSRASREGLLQLTGPEPHFVQRRRPYHGTTRFADRSFLDTVDRTGTELGPRWNVPWDPAAEIDFCSIRGYSIGVTFVAVSSPLLFIDHIHVVRALNFLTVSHTVYLSAINIKYRI